MTRRRRDEPTDAEIARSQALIGAIIGGDSPDDDPDNAAFSVSLTGDDDPAFADLIDLTAAHERLKAAARVALGALDQYRSDMQFPPDDKGSRLRRIAMATEAMNGLREALS